MQNKIGILVLAIVALNAVSAAHADGVLIPGRWPQPGPIRHIQPPPPPFAIKYHHVDVTIDEQVARTHIDQVFESEYGREMEATYIFPIPEGAAIEQFSLWIGNEKVDGKVLDADEARRIYEQIVRRRKDPGLLEYVGRGLFRARVYPVPPHGEMRIELEYTELLIRKNDTVRYSYPLNTERFSSRPIESVRVSVDIASRTPIRNVYSPSHRVSVRRPGDRTASIDYEEANTRPDIDLDLYYTLSDDDVGLGLLTYTPPGEDGYFIFLASPRAEIQQTEIEAKDVVFVFDRTGSMSGEKIEQAREALAFCLRTLNPGDRFNVLPFNEQPDPLFRGLVRASEERIDEALEMTRSLDAAGGTNIDEALRTALPLLDDRKRPSYVLFLTDGLPTVGTTDVGEILRSAEKAAPSHVRLFAFGVGYDVNTTLLDKLSLQHKGTNEYVRPGEDIEVKVSSLFRMISYPVLTDLDLDFGGMKAYDVLPAELPDLFKGSQLALAGRFRGTGRAKITLSGKAAGQTHRFRHAQSLAESSEVNDFIPLIWAQRKIGFLLEEIRIHGRDSELIEEIVRLSKKHGIITEYTSFLVEEPGMVVARDFEKRATTALREEADEAMAGSSGSWSVNQNVNIARSKKAANAPSPVQTYYDAEGKEVTVASVRNLQNRAFYQQASNWIEGNYVEGEPVLAIKNYSRAQFQLLERDPSLGELMALGEEVLFLVNGRAVQMGASGAEELTEEELRELFGS